MLQSKLLAVLLIFIIFCNTANAQGCSDAGFCTISHYSTKPPVLKNEFVFGTVYGIGEASVNVITPYFLYNRKFGTDWLWGNKITASYFSGKLGSTFNAGDFYSVVTYAKKNADKKVNWQYSGGIKIPFTNSDVKISGHAAPMPYQSSIGTYDFIGAVGLAISKVDISTAIQIPVKQINENSFFNENLTTNDFPSTNQFRRKSDFLLRGGYTFITNKWTFKPNLLNIFHLGNDTYVTRDSKRTSIEGSSGLTININLIAQLKLKNYNYLEFSIASPLLYRTVRPDGLTRSLTLGVEYHFFK